MTTLRKLRLQALPEMAANDGGRCRFPSRSRPDPDRTPPGPRGLLLSCGQRFHWRGELLLLRVGRSQRRWDTAGMSPRGIPFMGGADLGPVYLRNAWMFSRRSWVRDGHGVPTPDPVIPIPEIQEFVFGCLTAESAEGLHPLQPLI